MVTLKHKLTKVMGLLLVLLLSTQIKKQSMTNFKIYYSQLSLKTFTVTNVLNKLIQTGA